NSNTVSRAGAQGIAQFMPKTAAEFGLVNPFEPIEALHAAGRFLSQLRDKFGNLGLAAAAYNAGPGRVIDFISRRNSLPGETRNYALGITGRPADQWAAIDPHRNPEARLMPARAPCIEVTEAVAHQAKTVRVTKLMSELTAATGSTPARDAPAGNKRDEEMPLIASAPPQRKRSALKVASGALKAVHQRRTQKAVAAAELAERPAGRPDAATAA